jgi:hypothetical protein
MYVRDGALDSYIGLERSSPPVEPSCRQGAHAQDNFLYDWHWTHWRPDVTPCTSTHEPTA